MNKLQFERRSVIYEQFKEDVEWILDEFIQGRETITSWEIYGDYIEINTEYSRCGCCGPDYETYKMPTSYIWDEDWKEKEKARKEKEERQKAAAAHAREAKAAKDAKSKREAQYAKLKEEFESTA